MKNYQVFVVKEPYFTSINDGGYALRVDHVSDIAEMSIRNEDFPVKWAPDAGEVGRSALSWKDEGNDAVREHNWLEAIEWYRLSARLP